MKMEYSPRAFFSKRVANQKCGLRDLQQNGDLHAGHTRHACASLWNEDVGARV
jgi:hypothetical protein